MRSLLIDVGSTYIKYSVYDDSNEEIIVNNKVPFPEPLVNSEHKFLVSVKAIKTKIKDIFTLTERFNCKKAFFGVQMHGYIIRKKDNEFTHYVSWRDTSGDITDCRFNNTDFNKMGTSLKNNLPLVKIAFKNYKGEFFTLGSYIIMMLTGKNATHITDACASGFFQVDTGKPNEYATNLVMPEVYKEITPIGTYNGVQIYTPLGDHQISFLGSGADEDKYLINIGTATQVSCLHNESYPDGEYEKRPFFNRQRLYTISGLVGGDKIYFGEGKEELLGQILKAISELPPKKEILLGGGGAKNIYEFLIGELGKHNLKCSLIKNNIGTEGLKMIAEQNRIKAGTMLSEICFPNFPVIAKNNGLDFIIIDNEHGCFDYSDLSRLIITANLIGMETIVRIGDNSRGHITKLADMGVCGFLLPMTNCREDIEKVVKYAKYSPVGERGVSTTRAHTLYNPPVLTEYMKVANEKMRVYAQIETVSGVENIDKILAVNGVDGLFIGPNDLSVDMQCIADKETLLKAIDRIAEASRTVKKPFGIITSDKELIQHSISNNASMISVGSELNMLINGCKKIKEEI
ncbi:MAG: hypothetical protein IJF30_02055 [Clostridia bacterium]|nr:hypothetical protein [Clostridia bacterium]MBQ9997690.1 hypothetical protein [Clostridia bacterium]